MKQDTKRLSSIILALLLIVAALVVYFEFIVPSYQTLETTKGQEESELALYANEQQIASKVQSLLTSYQSNSSSSQSVALALPIGPGVSGVLAQVYGIAQNTGVTLQGSGIAVQAVQGPTSARGIAGVAANGSIVAPVGSISLSLTGTGSYEAFKSFLQGLEGNIRIFDVTNISLSPAAPIVVKGQLISSDSMTFSVTVVTYYQAQ